MLFFRSVSPQLSTVSQGKVSMELINKQRSFFKTLIDHEVTVELKNDIQLKGILKSVDQYLNIKLDDIQVVEELKYPHLVCLPSTISLFHKTIPTCLIFSLSLGRHCGAVKKKMKKRGGLTVVM
ncbi:hypothetical protein MKX07_006317 [Trichoderma sp. CBMAI-0711]|nr:hypothetical protein MKX07_006317 [Trichoderma sp. CBMAI-0711]